MDSVCTILTCPYAADLIWCSHLCSVFYLFHKAYLFVCSHVLVGKFLNQGSASDGLTALTGWTQCLLYINVSICSWPHLVSNCFVVSCLHFLYKAYFLFFFVLHISNFSMFLLSPLSPDTIYAINCFANEFAQGKGFKISCQVVIVFLFSSVAILLHNWKIMTN